MNEPLIFDKTDWMDAFRHIAPHIPYSERLKFWEDCQRVEKSHAEKRETQAA